MIKLIAVLLAVGIPIVWGVGMFYIFELLRRRNTGGHSPGPPRHGEKQREQR